MSNAGIDGGGGGGGGGGGASGSGSGSGVPPTTPPPTGHGSTRRLSHLTGGSRSGGAAAMGNVVGWLKQVLSTPKSNKKSKNVIRIDVNYLLAHTRHTVYYTPPEKYSCTP